MRTDGWTDMTKLTVALRNFATSPKNRVVENVRSEVDFKQQCAVQCNDAFSLFVALFA
jgi:hypothetical protein